MNRLFRVLCLAFLGFLCALPFSIHAQYKFTVNVCPNKPPIENQSLRRVSVSHDGDNPYAPIQCTINSLNSIYFNIKSTGEKGVFEGTLDGTHTDLFAIESWIERSPPESEHIVGATTQEYAVIDGGYIGSYFYNTDDCEFVTGEINVKIRVCPDKDLSVVCQRPYAPKDSTIEFSANHLGLIREAYQWYYSINGGTKQAWAGKGASHRVKLKDFPHARAGDEIYVFLKTCDGFSVSKKLQYFPALPDCIDATLSVDAPCHIGNYNELVIKFDRPFSSDIKEHINSVDLIRINNQTGQYTIIHTWDTYHNSGALRLKFPEQINPGNYHLIFHGSIQASSKDKFALSSRVVPLTISRPLQLQTRAEAFVSPCVDSLLGRIDISLNAPTGQANGYQYVLTKEGVQIATDYLNNTTQTASVLGLATGNYQVYCYDLNTCASSTYDIYVGSPSPINLDYTQLDCPGTIVDPTQVIQPNTGSLEIRSLGANYPISEVKWQHTSLTAQRLDDLKPGKYTAMISYQNNRCRHKASFQVKRLRDTLDVRLNIQPVRCYNQAEAQVVLNGGASGQQGARHYWYNANNTMISSSYYAQKLRAGRYRIQSYKNSLQHSQFFELKNPPRLFFDYEAQPVLCYGESNGQAHLSAYGGTGELQVLWSDYNTEWDRNDLPVGQHPVTLSDANGCKSERVVTIAQPSPLIIASQDVQTAACQGEPNGYIHISLSGGTPPYSWLWNDGSRDSVRRKLLGDIYTYQARDANQCLIEGSVDIRANDPMVITQAKVQHVTYYCAQNGHVQASEHDGSIEISVSKGSPPYRFLWSNGSTQSKITALSPGIYQVSIKDARGCILESSYRIESREPLIARIAIIDSLSCFGTKDATIRAEATGGDGSFKRYMWGHGIPVATIKNVGAGFYSVQISDAHCTSSAILNLGQPDRLHLEFEHVAERCSKDGSGLLIAHAKGGTQPYEYIWSDLSSSDTIRNPLALVYQLQLIDRRGCGLEQYAFITHKPPMIWRIESRDPSYTGIQYHQAVIDPKDGHLSMSMLNGQAPFKFKINGSPSSAQRDDLDSGRYELEVIDHSGCQSDTTVMLSRVRHLEVDLIVRDSIACHQDKNGAIISEVQGGTPPYLYRWNQIFIQTTGMQDLAAGRYHVQVTDAKGVHTVDTVCLPMPDPLTLVLESDSLTGWMSEDGRIRLQCHGGTSPYDITWSHGGKSAVLEGLSSGTYHVDVVDAHGCRNSGSVNVYSPDSLFLLSEINHGTYGSASYGIVNPKEFDAYISVEVQGGVAPYHYQWSHGAQTARIDGLSAGWYRVVVTDAKGYQISNEYEIQTPEPLVAQCILKNGIRCYGEGMAHVWATVQGGTPPYRYIWGAHSIDTQDHFCHDDGKVSLRVIDALGIESIDSLWINEPDSLSIELDAVAPSGWGAQDGRIVSAISGGTEPYHYNWSNQQSQPLLEGLEQGCYSLEITDSLGCLALSEICIESPDSLSLRAQLTHCSYSGNQGLQLGEQFNDGRISLQAHGGVKPYRYVWSDGYTGEQREDLDSGQYSVEVYDAHDYRVQGSFTIESPEPLKTELVLVEKIYCHQESTAKIQSQIQGGRPPYQWRWSTGDSTRTLEKLAAGTYRLDVSDSEGIRSHAILSIDEPEALRVTLITDSITGHDRNDGQIRAMVDGGTPPYHFFWYARDVMISSDTVLNDLGEGIYYLDVIDDAGCQKTESCVLNRPSELIVEADIQPCSYRGSVQGQEPESPKDGHISLKVSGGFPPYEIQWEHGDQEMSIEGLNKGYYTVSITDMNENKVFKKFFIDQKAPLMLRIESIQELRCYGDSDASLEGLVHGGTEPYRYIWNTEDHSSTITNLEAGEYVLNVIDSLDVVASYVWTVREPEPLTLEYTALTGDCSLPNTGTISLRAQGGLIPYQYLWSDGYQQPTRDALPNGYYAVTVSDHNACSIMDTIVLKTTFEMSIEEMNPIRCFQESNGHLEVVACGGIKPYRYLWSTGDSSQSIEQLKAGTYSVTVWDHDGDSIKDTFILQEPLPLMIHHADVYDPLCSYSDDGHIRLELTGGTQPYALAWSNQSYGQSIVNLGPGTYQVMIHDVNGCELSEEFQLAAPTPLRAQVSTTDPTCFGYNDASINVQGDGGLSPYSLQLTPWYPFKKTETKAVTHRWTDLSPGLYLLSVQDSNTCRFDTIIRILAKPAWDIYLGSARNLCAGQVDTLKLNDTTLSYRWTLPDLTERWGPTVLVNQGGMYRLSTQDSLGCSRKDSVWVRMATDTLRSVFWVSSRVFTEEEVVIANMVFDRFDSIRWIAPNGVQILEYTPYYLHLFFKDTGTYPVGMWVFRGHCADFFEVMLRVRNSDIDESYTNHIPIDSLSLTISPNPAEDHVAFTFVNPKMGQWVWQIFDVAQGRKVLQGHIKLGVTGEHNGSFPCATWPRGAYVLRLYNGVESISEKFILK